jgi:hypothetical protein
MLLPAILCGMRNGFSVAFHLVASIPSATLAISHLCNHWVTAVPKDPSSLVFFCWLLVHAVTYGSLLIISNDTLYLLPPSIYGNGVSAPAARAK